MSERVEKWAANIWCNQLYVARVTCRKTTKMFIVDRDSSGDAKPATDYQTNFPHGTNLLHDTEIEALDALDVRIEQDKLKLRAKLEKLEDHQKTIKKSYPTI